VLSLAAPDGRTITLEPGAQIEFATGLCDDVPAIAAQVGEYFEVLARLGEEFDVAFLALGAHPGAAPDEIERIPKERYRIMEPYLAGSGDLGVWMMKATAGIQVNLDHADEADAMAKLRLVFALSPLLTALFANSPVRAREASGFASWRGHVWSRTDPARCGLVEALARPDSSFEDYVDWALAAPMLFVQRDGRFRDMRGRNFRQFLEAGAGDLRACYGDWELHLSTLFPEARFRPQLELRSFDTQCPPRSLALCALAEGLFYRPQAMAEAWERWGGWSHAERVQTWRDGHRAGLAAIAPDGRPLLEHARDLLAIVDPAPASRCFLYPLTTLLEQGESAGERLARSFTEEWGRSVPRLVEEVRCIRGRTGAV